MLSYTVRLGRGRLLDTFAAVLEADSERMDVAVKRPRGELSRSPEFKEAFEAWGKAQLDVEGTRLVAVLEVGSTDDGPYVIQERVEGASLARVLSELSRKRRSLRPHLAVRMAKAIVEALAELHDNDRIHGRLDPGEVLISFEGDVFVGDQGSYVLDAHSTEPEPPTKYRLAGTIEPMVADLQAWALVTIEMMVGFPIWTSENMTVERAVEAVRDFSPLGLARPELAKELGVLLLSCFQSEAARRPTSARAVFERIAELTERFEIEDKPSELGAFVRTIIPVRREDDAPTMIASAPPERAPMEERNEFKVATVAVDVELLRYLDSGGARPEKTPAHRGVSVPIPPPAPTDAVELSSRWLWVAGLLLAFVLVFSISRC